MSKQEFIKRVLEGVQVNKQSLIAAVYYGGLEKVEIYKFGLERMKFGDLEDIFEGLKDNTFSIKLI